jgi:DNA-binding GntR family transcriptional regulator
MQKETLKERVYRGIYEAVTNGEYRPNDILTENQMIEKFGVSKSPVREALVELCKDGVLINIPRMGYQVRAVTLKEIMDILEFRVDVEVGGLRKSFPVLTRENINMLRMIAEKHNADEDRIVSNNWQRNYEFHINSEFQNIHDLFQRNCPHLIAHTRNVDQNSIFTEFYQCFTNRRLAHTKFFNHLIFSKNIIRSIFAVCHSFVNPPVYSLF